MSRAHLLFLFPLIFYSLSANAAERKFAWPPDLVSSRALIEIQNRKAEDLNISQIQEDNLRWFRNDGRLILLPRNTKYFYVPSGHVLNKYRLIRPWAKEYIELLSKDYHERFNKKLKITSAVRTMEYQRRLRKRNRNTVDYRGIHASLHTRGNTFDISKKGMSRRELTWMRERLIEDKFKNFEINSESFHMDPTEERYCYHIVVFPNKKLPD